MYFTLFASVESLKVSQLILFYLKEVRKIHQHTRCARYSRFLFSRTGNQRNFASVHPPANVTARTVCDGDGQRSENERLWTFTGGSVHSGRGVGKQSD